MTAATFSGNNSKAMLFQAKMANASWMGRLFIDLPIQLLIVFCIGGKLAQNIKDFEVICLELGVFRAEDKGIEM